MEKWCPIIKTQCKEKECAFYSNEYDEKECVITMLPQKLNNIREAIEQLPR